MSIESTPPKKIVIFDKQFKNPKAFEEPSKALMEVEARHSVIRYANCLAGSVELLLELSEGLDDRPDIIITAGKLSGESAYISNPIVEALIDTTDMRGQTGKRVPQAAINQFLLPIVDEEGRVSLPAVHTVKQSLSDSDVQLVREGYYRGKPGSTLSGFVIAHLAKELLPPGIKVIGHASGWFGENVPLDAFVPKGGNGDRTLLEEVESPVKP